jgi:hypothetical protein
LARFAKFVPQSTWEEIVFVTEREDELWVERLVSHADLKQQRRRGTLLVGPMSFALHVLRIVNHFRTRPFAGITLKALNGREAIAVPKSKIFCPI